ncbi:MAG: SpoIID/LytB domain-containing protein [Ruminiclostridium sp.]
MGRLILAFSIMSIYIFLFGIMENIESLDVSISAETEEMVLEIEDEDYSPAVTSAVDENGRAVYTYATELNVMNARKPGLGDYTGTEARLIVPLETKETTVTTTEPADFSFNDDDFDYTTPLKTTAPVTTTTSATTTKETTRTTRRTEETTPESVPSESDTTRPPEEETVTTEDTEETEGEGQPFETDIEDIEDEPEETTAATEATEESTTTSKPETEIIDNGVMFTVNSSGKTVTDTALNIVAQAVMAEIGDGFNDEAIKAQAIATYTYIKYYNDNNQKAYIVSKKPSDKMLRLVSEVLGKTLYYDGKIIQAVYCASTAGYTASSKNVWGVDYPYLRSKETEFDRSFDINYGRKPTFTSKEMHDYVYKATGIDLTGDPSTWFTIESYVDNVYVGNMTIGGQTTYTKNGKIYRFTGRHFRETIMGYDIRSHCFDISYDSYSDEFTITTYGYGHGVGLSQHGANILANQYGYTYEQILAFYYEGAEIK